MTKKLQHLFALSEKGANDLVKAVIWCFVCNLSLMFPVGAVLFTVQHLLDSMENGGSPMDGFWIYAGFAPTAIEFFRKPGSKRPDLYHDRRLLQPGSDVFPLRAAVVRIHFLHSCDRHRYVLL